jgi:outer membrane protein assembly factor BamB
LRAAPRTIVRRFTDDAKELGMIRRRSAASSLLVITAMLTPLAARAAADDIATLVSRIKAVGGEGQGNVAAREASGKLAKLQPDAIPKLLGAMNDADPVAANWLRGAIDAIADRAVSAGQPLPTVDLEAFVLESSHAGPVRRLAYEWLSRVDAAAPDRIIPRMLDDPSVEMRRDAVAREIDAAQRIVDGGDEPAARAAFEKVFAASRDYDQVDLIAKRLKSLGHEVNLTRHFGCVQQWRLIAPFDNTDKQGFDATYPPEKKLDLEAEYSGKDDVVRWIEYRSPDTYGVVDLNKVIGKHMGVVAYATSTVESAGDRPVSIRAGSPNAIKIWLNGRLIFTRDEYHHGMSMDQYEATGRLKPGRNTILIKVCQNEQTEDWAQNWMFQLRVCDLTGGGILDATTARQSQLESPFAPRKEPALFAEQKATIRLGTRWDDLAELAARLLVLMPCIVPPAAVTDWPQWRGSDSSGVSSEAGLPDQWTDTENVRWKAELPGRGVSSPVVARGRVYVTASSGLRQDRLHVLCFDAATGQRLWERQFWATGGTACHPKTAMAAPTPATDGQRVYALFATCDLVCLDADGTLVWYRSLARDYPNISNQVGMAASPILWNDSLLLSLETDAESFAFAIDKHSGINRWKIPRNKDINWVTPLILRRGSGAELLLQSRHEITAYDPETGETRWTHEAGLDAIPSPISGRESVFVPAGEVLSLRPGSPEQSPEVLWKSAKLRASTASPILYQDRIYAVNSAGVLTCADPSDGEVLWQERLKGPFSASPVAADDKLYFFNEEGLGTVVHTKTEPRVIATNSLGEPILASPAVAQGALFIRSDKHLFCIGATP